MKYLLPERLKELRTERGIRLTRLAAELGLGNYTVNRWENGMQVPSAIYIMKLCIYFNCSSDFLLGLKNE
ncbi:MAG: helix-turn-helix domain-containing protein [Firmicutes bacterium]|nr:helix-turn-helix domain-containing protein [Bacillota bacterium]